MVVWIEEKRESERRSVMERIPVESAVTAILPDAKAGQLLFGLSHEKT